MATYQDTKEAAHAALLARDSIEFCGSPEWRAANKIAGDLYLQARALAPNDIDTMSRCHANPVRVVYGDLHGVDS